MGALMPCTTKGGVMKRNILFLGFLFLELFRFLVVEAAAFIFGNKGEFFDRLGGEQAKPGA